ncbi:Osmotically inducible protein Y precursor [Sandaracinus amylolyticus]|uniref:Osmotically inducible protein Y n=1 Tax=Sandaracinus amylolyticus TaxID=927083 RepID=A0A0F6W705_9BACT|nr:Osmotically inducible protein Y precursor [Sandaracinus amylolyticus]
MQRPRATTTRPAATASRGVATRTEETAHDRTSIDDEDIGAALRRRLARDDALPPNAVAVAIDRGVATLSGTVPHLPAARRARAIAASTRGVVDVVSRIEVRGAARGDETLEDEVRRAIQLDPAMADRAIEIEVHDSVVTLRSVVGTLTEARLAEEIAGSVRGVRAVQNDLQLEPMGDPTDEQIRAAVLARIERDVRIDPAGIDVMVDDGTVALSGVVGSVAERDVAHELAEVSGARVIDPHALEVQWWTRDTLRRDATPLDDGRITSAVRDTITNDPRVRAPNLAIGVTSGLATLRGIVPSAYARASATEDALNVVGVRRVGDQLQVQTDAVENGELQQRVAERLAASAWTSESEIDVEAREGRVTLRGTVPSRFLERAARDVATRIVGVREVADEIALEEDVEPLEDWELAAEVQSGLEWNPFLDRMNVQVTASEGVATLRGEVDDVRAFREAEREAEAAGALEVVNELSIRAVESVAPRTPAPVRIE